LDEIDAFFVLLLYMEAPSRGFHIYALWLEHFTVMQVSDSLLSQLFNDAFPIRGGMHLPNHIPLTNFALRIVSEQ
jgi:hypothetical protein